MRARLGCSALLLTAVMVGTTDAQQRMRARTALLYESYSVDSGLAYSDVSELTIPVTVDIPLGRGMTVTLSSGYASAAFTSALPEALGDQSVSGMLDTQARLSYNVIPGRLILLVTGTIPSGRKTLEESQLFLLGPLSSDIIGFSAATLGTGGSFGGGFAGALPLGRWALGIGGTYRQALSYLPVRDQDDKLKPGSELRVRLGVEGPLARRTYLRFAGIFAARAKDQLAGVTQNGIGNRTIAYFALSQGLGGGGASLTLYSFNVFRSDPQIIGGTDEDAALLPRGNLFALGGQFGFGLGRSTRVVPRVEYRVSALASAGDLNDKTLRRAGSTFRFGADLRQQLSRRLAAVLSGSGVTGTVVQAGADLGLNGYRMGLTLELTP